MQPAAAILFDGLTAARQDVTVGPSRDLRGLLIQRAEEPDLIWPLDRLRVIADPVAKDRVTLTLHADTDDEAPRDPARLVLADAALIVWLRRAAPDLGRRDPRPGTALRIVIWSAGALAALLAILFVFLPRISDTLAENLPLEREVAFGDSVVNQLHWFLAGSRDTDLTCSAKAGVAALKKLQLRLTEGQDLRYPLQIKVLDHPMVNAFAAPGGHVVLLRGLLEKAENAEEVVGVLAHEIGHIEARDPTRLAFRSAGSAGILSLILGDASGGFAIALLGDQLISAAYTRDAEEKADAFAYDFLQRAGISSRGMATFFDRIDKIDGDLPTYLSTHPDSAGRAAEARAADTGTGAPVLTPVEWAALRAVCTK